MVVIDIYPTSNFTGAYVQLRAKHPSTSSLFSAVGQCFKITQPSRVFFVKFHLRKVGSPIGNLVVKIGRITGTFGTDAIPTGSALVTSKIVSMAGLSTTFTDVLFEFETLQLLPAGNYCIALETLDDPDPNGTGAQVQVGIDTTNPTHQGNYFRYAQGTTSPGWAGTNVVDVTFEVNGETTGAYTLNINASPTIVPLTIDGVSVSTPVSVQLTTGSHTIVTPPTIVVNQPPPAPAVTLTFVEWEDGSKDPTRVINLTSDMTIKVTYAVRVEAIPDANNDLDHWTLDGANVGSDNPIYVGVDVDHTLGAVFVVKHILTIESSGGGTTDPIPGIYKAVEGAQVQVSQIAESDHMFSHWLLDGINKGDITPYPVTMDTDHTLRAVFVIKPPPPPDKHHLTVSTTVGGTTNPVPPGTWEYDIGATFLEQAVSDDNHTFDHWELDGVIHTENPISITMDADHNLLAVFVVKPPPLSLWKAAAAWLATISGGLGAVSQIK